MSPCRAANDRSFKHKDEKVHRYVRKMLHSTCYGAMRLSDATVGHDCLLTVYRCTRMAPLP